MSSGQIVLDNIQEKSDLIVNDLYDKLNSGVSFVDSFNVNDVLMLIDEKINLLTSIVSNITESISDPAKVQEAIQVLKGVAAMVSNELQDPDTQNIIVKMLTGIAQTSLNAGKKIAETVPIIGPFVVVGTTSLQNATRILESFNQLSDKYKGRILAAADYNPLRQLQQKIQQPQVQEGGGYKGILKQSKIIQRRTSKSVDKFLNPSRSRHNNKKTNKRRNYKGATVKVKRVRIKPSISTL